MEKLTKALRRSHINICAPEETRWYGIKICDVDALKLGRNSCSLVAEALNVVSTLLFLRTSVMTLKKSRDLMTAVTLYVFVRV